MTIPKLLGLDVGTSNAKAVLIDANGFVLGTASRSHPTISPRTGFQEQRAEDWWRGIVGCIRDILDETGIDSAEISGISLSGQGCACQPIDRSGDPLGRATIWTDERAKPQQTQIREIFGEHLGSVAGNEIYDQPEPRMMWLRDHEPERYRQTDKFLSTVSYILLRLTGRVGANQSDWGFHLAYDRVSGDWNEDFVRAINIDSDKFPRLYKPTDIVAGVSEDAASETGLKSGTPVVAGGQDSTVGALAVGALLKGQSLYMRGTTDLLCICTDQPEYHPGLYTTCAVLPGLYMSYDMKEVIAAGGSYKWLASTLFSRTDDETFEMMNGLAANVPPGAGGLLFLPYLLMSTNPDHNQERSGSFFGLSINTSRAEMCRAVMEGTAYALREALGRMKTLGIVISELRAIGSPTRSGLWNQITADITGLPVLLSASSAGAAYGAALLAGLGVGIYPMDDGYKTLESVVKLSSCFDPQTGAESVYTRTYLAFCELAARSCGLSAMIKET